MSRVETCGLAATSVRIAVDPRKGSASGVCQDKTTSVSTGHFDVVSLDDLGLDLQLPPDSVSHRSAKRARKQALRIALQALNESELLEFIEEFARVQRHRGYKQAIKDSEESLRRRLLTSF